MLYNFNKPLLALDGKEIPESNIGQTLAALLANASDKNDPIRMYELAKMIYQGTEVEIHKGDKKMIEEFVKSSSQLTNLGKSQILEVLEKGIETTV